MKYDAIIVGSGIGGMTAALILARARRKVLVLEQHSVPGGLMQVFRRKGMVFPTGVHCLGSLQEGQILWRYLEYLGVMDKIELVPMDPDGFEEYCFPGACFRVPVGHGAFEQRMIEYFPEEREAVRAFCADMKETAAHFALYNLHPGMERTPTEAQCQPLRHYLDGLGASHELQAVLTAINPLYGVAPRQCPLFSHFLVFDSFLKSAWRVDEASRPLVSSFTERLEELGGDLRCQARVKEIQSTGRKVDRVVLASGERIEAPVVVFTGHPRQLTELCPAGALRTAFKERLLAAPDTPGAFGLALAWSAQDCPPSLRDVFLYSTWDTGEPHSQRPMESGETPSFVFCGGSPRPVKARFAVMALCHTHLDEMWPWTDSRVGARPEGYREAKAALAERVLSVLELRWPEAAPGIEVLSSFSPLTFRDYTLSPLGSAYGLKKSVGDLRSSRLTPATRIRGLFLAGQSVILPGVLGTVISSVSACRLVLRGEDLVEKIRRETR